MVSAFICFVKPFSKGIMTADPFLFQKIFLPHGHAFPFKIHHGKRCFAG
jgi:hypothetical protein